MKYLKKSNFFAMILVFAFTFPQWAAAQDKGAARMDKMQTELNLTDQQVTEIKVIHEGYRTEMKALRGSENPDKKTIQNFRQKKEAAILEVLNEEQTVIYRANKEKRKGMKKEHSDKRKALKTELKTYNNQQVKPVLVQKRNEFDATLSDADRAEIADLRESFKNLKKGSKGHGAKAGKSNRGQSFQKDQELASHKKGSGRNHKGFKKAMEENPELEQRTMALLNKYSKALETVDSQLAPQREQWKADKQNILAKHLEPAMLEKMAAKKAEKDAGKKADFERIHFLLMDPAR